MRLNRRMAQISVEPTGVHVTEGEIKKIVEAINYIDRMESDIPNVQIDRRPGRTDRHPNPQPVMNACICDRRLHL